jgi:Ca2+-binding EF-hand superfamily protein
MALQWPALQADAIEPGRAVNSADTLRAAQSQAQRRSNMRFSQMDRNNDGQISRAEWTGSDRSFEVHDWNNDGRLSGDEVRVGSWQNVRIEDADHDPSRAERYLSWTEMGFANLDHNRDRRVTPNEWHYDQETFIRADRDRDGSLDRVEFLGTDVEDDRGDQFDDIDINGNNRIERSEWHASDDAFEWLDRNGDGVLSRFEVTGTENTRTARDQFASLDYDGNGEISPAEWHWSYASFRRLDQNRDDALSRGEFNAGTDAENGSNQPHYVTVNAQQQWTDTGVTVRAGDVLTLAGRGTVQLAPDPNDVASPAGSKTGRRAPSAPVNATAGALIGRIGNSDPFVVGNQGTLRAPASGRLFLGVNDDHMADNSGAFEVSIAVRRTR